MVSLGSVRGTTTGATQVASFDRDREKEICGGLFLLTSLELVLDGGGGATSASSDLLEAVLCAGKGFDGIFLVGTEGAMVGRLELRIDFFGLLGALSVIIKNIYKKNI